jgi:hypothetical protein
MTTPQNNSLNQLREKIDPDELARQGFPRPSEVRLSKRPDSNGEAALYVYLVFPDNTPEKNLAWSKIEKMVSWVRDLALNEIDDGIWPYVKVKRKKELAGGTV